MSEPTEKKILKDALARMKTRNITSATSFKKRLTYFFRRFDELFNSFQKTFPRLTLEDKEKLDTVLLMLEVVRNDISMLIMSSNSVIEDMQGYIAVLESYSSELDKTLTEIFAQAKKEAEDQLKQQEDMTKKEPEYRV